MNFDLAFDRLIGSEGGYINDPNDPGGETNWGISKRSYPGVDIKHLTRAGAKAIYLVDFWNRIHADEMYGGAAFQAFDFSVNSGIETAVRELQRAIGVAPDGHWGPVTRAAAAAVSEAHLIMLVLSARLEFMTRLSNWQSDGKGWARRIAQDLRYGVGDS